MVAVYIQKTHIIKGTETTIRQTSEKLVSVCNSIGELQRSIGAMYPPSTPIFLEEGEVITIRKWDAT